MSTPTVVSQPHISHPWTLLNLPVDQLLIEYLTLFFFRKCKVECVFKSYDKLLLQVDSDLT